MTFAAVVVAMLLVAFASVDPSDSLATVSQTTPSKSACAVTSPNHHAPPTGSDPMPAGMAQTWHGNDSVGTSLWPGGTVVFRPGGPGSVLPEATHENHERLLIAAAHRTRREVERLVAMLRPMPDAPSTIRKLPQAAALVTTAPESMLIDPTAQAVGDSATAASSTRAERAPVRPPAPAIVRPLTPERYKVQFTIGPETHQKLRRVQDLMRHSVPNGDVAEIFDRAVTLLLEEVERRTLAQVGRPRNGSSTESSGRHVPSAVKRAVWARDQGRCAFVGAKGRCEERGFLEFHHVIPFADGGATTVGNVELRCRSHNAYEARRHFGLPLSRDAEPIDQG